MISGLDEIKVEPLEYGFLVDDTWYTSPVFHIWLPKLLPLVTGIGSAQKKNIVIDNNIFINEEKPQTSSTIPTRNYLTIPKFRQADFEFKLENFDSSMYIKKGEKFMISVMHGNIKDMYVTDNI